MFFTNDNRANDIKTRQRGNVDYNSMYSYLTQSKYQIPLAGRGDYIYKIPHDWKYLSSVIWEK